MPELFTTCYGRFNPKMGQPVVTSLGTPKSDVVKAWPVAHLLTPRWSYWKADPENFRRQYLEQLDRFGPEKIARMLQRIAEETGESRLVLLCWEADWEKCHRSMLADWLLERTGELVCEITAAPRAVKQSKERPKGPGPLPFMINPTLIRHEGDADGVDAGPRRATPRPRRSSPGRAQTRRRVANAGRA